MANPLIPRERLHAQVEDIHGKPVAHREQIQFLLRSQRILTGWVTAAARNTTVPNARVVYLAGVILRLFDLAGGKLKRVKMPAIRGAEAQVAEAAPGLFPFDEGFADRLRAVGWRAQPHLLDECLSDLFDDDEDALEPADAAKLLLTMWVVIEAVDGAWSPPPGFEGAGAYRFTPVGDEATGDPG